MPRADVALHVPAHWPGKGTLRQIPAHQIDLAISGADALKTGDEQIATKRSGIWLGRVQARRKAMVRSGAR